jgi:hypothetical protein
MLLFTQWLKNRHVFCMLLDKRWIQSSHWFLNPLFDPQGRDDKVIVFKFKKKKKYQRKLGHRQVHFQ